MSGSRIDTPYQHCVTFHSGPSANGQQPVASIAKQLVAQLHTPWGEASPSLQPPRRRRRVLAAGGCGGLRYPLCGMLRPATPRKISLQIVPLKILNRPVRTASGTINYRFRELLEALNLLGTEERTWIVSGAIVTWPEELLDERMEVHDPRIRFPRDGHGFACTQEVMVQIADGIEGDWTDIWVAEGPHGVLGSVDLDKLDHRMRFRCIDAAFWVVESADHDLSAKLAAHGFATEPYDGGHLISMTHSTEINTWLESL